MEDLDSGLDAEAQAYSRMLIADFRARDWRRSIRSLHDQAFLFPWQAHLQRLNGDLRRGGQNQLCTPKPDLPPAWFNGNIEKIEPRRWILFISLNPQLPGTEMDNLARTPEAWWQFWLTHNEDHWYGKFFTRPTRLASMVLDEKLADAEFPNFAASRMVYVEVCPYASSKFDLTHDEMTWLAREDIGFLIGHHILGLLLEGSPTAILVNGNPAIEYLDDAWHGSLTCNEWTRYTSKDIDKPTKTLRHREGSLSANRENIPVFEFPFLGTRATHNSAIEVKQLGDSIRSALLDRRKG